MSEEILADDFTSPQPQSYLMWILSALGWRYTFLLPVAGLLAFVVVAVLIWKGKGSALVGALIFVVPLPAIVGVVGVIDGLIASFQVIAMSNTSPRFSEIAVGFSMSLVSAWVGLLFAAPSYFLAAIGLILRAFIGEAHPVEQPLQAKIVA